MLGGNVEILKWLVRKHGCPISIRQDSRTGRLQSVQTSGGRSLVDLAMTGKPKLEVLRYLVMEKNLSVLDTKDPSLAPRTLEALLRAGVSRETAEASVSGEVVHVIDDYTEYSGTTLDDAVRKKCSVAHCERMFVVEGSKLTSSLSLSCSSLLVHHVLRTNHGLCLDPMRSSSLLPGVRQEHCRLPCMQGGLLGASNLSSLSVRVPACYVHAS